MKTLISTLLLLTFLTQNAEANEFRGGHISISQLSTSSVQADVVLLIDVHGDITDLDLCWGDGICSAITPTSIVTLASFGLKKYTFSILHSYQDQGTYTVSIESCCFDDELGNMLNAEDDLFAIETTMALNSSFNTTPSYSDLGAAKGSVNQGTGISGWDDDPEGDEYVTALCNIDVDTYQQPDIALPLPGNEIFNNSITGSISWISPPIDGTFVLQTCVTEFRDGVEISVSRRVVCFMIGEFVSATAEPIDQLGFSIYPNPIQDKKLWIHNDGTQPSETIKISIRNVSQQLVFEERTNTAFENKMIDLDGWTAGVYFVLMETEGGSFYKKFVVVE